MWDLSVLASKRNGSKTKPIESDVTVRLSRQSQYSTELNRCKEIPRSLRRGEPELLNDGSLLY
jgi:hypothetical protein